MKAAPLPANEAQRLAALRSYDILDTPAEEVFDELTRLAAQICSAPIALISLVDERRQWFKSRAGMAADEGPREASFCAHALLEADLFEVEDAAADARFADNPWVTGAEHVRFYAAMPLRTKEGFALGTLSVMDRQPRRLAPAQAGALRILSHQVMAQLELCRNVAELGRSVATHQRTEEQLRISDAFYQALVDSLPQNILRKDTEGRFTFVNRRFCEALGKKPEQILGRTDHDLFPPELAAKYHRDDLRVIATRQPLDTVEAHVTPQGEKLYVHVIKSPLLDTAGRVIGVQGIFWDVTQRRRVEEELAYERDLLQALLENIPDRIYFKDVHSRFLRCSRSLAQRLGLADPREVVGKTDFDFHPPEQAREFFEDEQRILLTGQPLINKLERLRGPAGEESWASVTKVPIYSQAGAVSGLIGLSRDVTKLIEAEQALRQAEEKYRTMYERSVEGIFQTTRDGHFLSANPALARIYGYESPQALVAALTDIEHQLYVDPGRRDEFRRLMREQGAASGFESQIYRRDRSVIWISESARSVHDAAGNFLYYEGTVEDITARKQVEFEREKARDSALEAARAKAQFLANVSHEIRTPMNAITGMAGLLADTSLNTEQRDYVETLRRSTEALLDIINDVLDFSKLEAGKLTLETIDFDLRDTVESTVEMLAERAHKKGIELACWIDRRAPLRLRGDPGRLRQVLANLVGNAVKFTSQGEVLVRVTRLEPAGPRAALRFEVKDTGIGIPPESMPRIFQEFTQADGTTTRKFGGTGLGLTISKQLVEMMQGCIGVDSVAGAGSTFWCHVPFEVAAEAAAGPGVPAPAPALAGLRVLVAEDIPSHRQIYRDMFESWQVTAEFVEHGAECLERLRRSVLEDQPFALAVLDMDLPDLDGLSLAQTIRGDPALAATRLILVANLVNRVNTAVLQTTGVSACLVKPLRMARLHDSLVDVLRGSGVLSAPGSAESTHPPAPGVVHPAARQVRILLAEDNSVNRQVAMLQLKKLGFEADCVNNGAQVLTALQQSAYDIIIMDCQMPEMDGYEVTRRIRTSGTDSYIHLRSAPYIIALTANALHGDRERCLAAGMNDYLTKPLRLADLDSVLQRAVLRLRPAASAEPVEPPESVLDRSVIDGLKQLREPNQPDPLADLVALFLRDARSRLAQLREAAAAADGRVLAAAAHALKGSSGNLGARRLASLCGALEKQAKAGDAAAAASTLPALLEEFARVEETLQKELD